MFLTLGSRAFAITRLRCQVVSLPLPKLARALLRREGRLAADATGSC